MKKLVLILLSLLLVGCTKAPDFNDDDDELPIEEKERFEVIFDENETFNSNEEKIASEHIDDYIKQAVVILNTIDLEEIEVLSEDYNLRLERNKLNDNAKQIYNALISNVSNYNDFNYEDKNTSSLISDFLSALTALKLDRRDLSLYCDFKYDYPYYKSVYYLPNQWMKECLDIDEVKAQVKIYQATIERIIEKMPNNLSNYYKCWYFVFVISLATKYDNSQITSLHQFQAYDCLVNGKCVCQGYTEAFYELCKAVNISCWRCVGESEGEAHSWNKVKTSKGDYYIDITWYDQNMIKDDYTQGAEYNIFMDEEKLNEEHKLKYYE